MSIDFSTKLVASADVLVRELDGEAVLLNLADQTYFGLDPVGTRIWQLVTTEPSIEAAHGVLLAEYDVAPEALRLDMTALLDQLLARGLVEIADP